MVEKSSTEREESDGAASSPEANFERVQQLSLASAEAWLVANDATVTRDAHYDAAFLFHDRCYHTSITVTYARGHHLYEAVMTHRINAQFKVVEGPCVSESSEQQTVTSPNEKERSVEQGNITNIVDAGSIIQVFIDTGEERLVLAADGNLFRRAETDYMAANNAESLVGTSVEFVRNDWGGLESFALSERQDVRCLNCRHVIPPEYDPSMCVFGRHAKRRR